MRELLVFVGLFVGIVFVINHWQVLLAIAAGLAVGKLLMVAVRRGLADWKAHRQAQAEKARQLLWDAKQQHRAYLEGSDLGLYGKYPPVDLRSL